MRVLMVGIGGAGCRIADMLYGHDQKSPSMHCTDGIVVDSDAVFSRCFKSPSKRKSHFLEDS